MRYLLVLLLAGCATGKMVEIDYSYAPPVDWPNLEEKLHYIEAQDFPKFCGRVPFGYHAHGCSVVRFDYEVCYIYLVQKDDALLEHERAHCRGYDHVGKGGVSHKALERWKSHKASQQ
jgi:hypothetical protein